MKIHTLLIIAFTFASFTVLGQATNTLSTEKKNLIDQDMENYLDVFNQVMDEKEHNLLLHLYDIQPDKLPEWFFQNNISHPKSQVIGVSDPGLDSCLAVKQAFHRAIAISHILNNTSFRNVADDYSNYIDANGYEDYSTKYQDFSKASNKLKFNPDDYQIIQTHFTKYQEAIVLVEYRPSNSEISEEMEITGEYLQTFIELDYGLDRIEFYNFNTASIDIDTTTIIDTVTFVDTFTKIDTLQIEDNLAIIDTTVAFNYRTEIDTIVSIDTIVNASKYNYKVVNKNFEINSEFENNKYELPFRSYNYTSNLQSDSIDFGDKLRFRLNKGLWNAYISSILYEMQSKGKQFPSQIKNSDDVHSQKAQGLIRTVSVNTLSFQISRFEIAKNVLLLELSARVCLPESQTEQIEIGDTPNQ